MPKTYDFDDVGEDYDDYEDDENAGERLPSFQEIDPFASNPEDRPDAQLADFQEEAIHRLNEHFRHNLRGLLCLPTGGGKTRTTLQWLFLRFVARHERVLWVCHRLDLLDQVQEEIVGLAWLLRRDRPSGFTVSRFGKTSMLGDIVLATAQTLARRAPSARELSSKNTPLRIVVYDEAHRALAPQTWAALEDLVTKRIPLLGLTATPFRSERNGTQKIRAQFGDPVYQRTFKDLIDIGFLAIPIFHRQDLRSTRAFQLKPADVDQIVRQRDLPPQLLGRLARAPGRNEEIVAHWYANRHIYGKTLAFACDIDHAEALADCFARRGARAASLHSDLDRDERRRRLDDFRKGALDVLVNVALLTEGANVPDTKTVLMARPTLSTTLYLQMIGRGARGPRTVPGKTDFHVVDCVDNFAIHGLFVDRNLSLAAFEVAAELNGQIAGLSADRAHEPGTSKQPDHAAARASADAARWQRTRAALATWLAAKGFAPRAYSLWGELRWHSPAGPCSVALFAETLLLVQEALNVLQQAMKTGDWARVASYAHRLDAEGAMRAVDWQAIVDDCRQTNRLPEFAEVPDLQQWSDQDVTTAETFRELLDLVRERGTDVRSNVVELWQRRHVLREFWPRPEDLWQSLVDAASAETATLRTATMSADVSHLLDAFVWLGLALARADGRVDDSERHAIVHAATYLLGFGRPDFQAKAQASLAGAEALVQLDLDSAITHLCALLDWQGRSTAFHLFFRVARADGRVVEQEVRLLEDYADRLHLPRHLLTQLWHWLEQPGSVSKPPLPGLLTAPIS